MAVDPTKPYDSENIFAKMLRGEIPCNTVYEDEWSLAFHDINPQADVHILVIPKGEYVSWDDFSAKASAEEIAGFVRAVGTCCPRTGAGGARLSPAGQCRAQWRAGSAASACPPVRRRSAGADAGQVAPARQVANPTRFIAKR